MAVGRVSFTKRTLKLEAEGEKSSIGRCEIGSPEPWLERGIMSAAILENVRGGDKPV